MVIYLDVLLLSNLWMDYFLLRAVARWTHCPLNSRRALLGAGLGALGALAIFLPPLPPILAYAGRGLLTLCLVRVAFGAMPWLALLRQTIWFLCTSFFFCGVVSVLGTRLTNLRTVSGNAVWYADLSLLSLLFAAVLAATLVSLTDRRGRLPSHSDWKLELTCWGQTILLPVLMDSGNGLTDVFSGKPVIVCPADAFAKLPDMDSPILDRLQTLRGFRMLPVQTVTGQQLLPAFLPSTLSLVRGKERRTIDALIAVTESHTPAIVPTIFSGAGFPTRKNHSMC